MKTGIDLFAGLGGLTEGARAAGLEVTWAANHLPLAVHYHQVNHPETVHACQDLQQQDWTEVPAHDVLLAAPACQGHSKARGKEKAHHDALRNTAWAVVDCAECHRSPFIVVENVPEFMDWELYPSWLDAMQRLGYTGAPHIIDAADHGVPQNRVRMFMVLTRSKAPIKLALPRRPHRPVASIIQWDAHRWSPVRTKKRSPITLARVAAGRRDVGDTFVMPYYSSGSGLTGRSIDRPIGTFSTVDRWAVVRGDEMRMLQPPEVAAGMGFRPGYRLPAIRRDAIFLLGNAVCPPVGRNVINALRRAA